MTQPSVWKRRRLAVFRTINCREQLLSAQGSLERVLKTAKRLRYLAQHQIPVSFALTHPHERTHGKLYIVRIHRYGISQPVHDYDARE